MKDCFKPLLAAKNWQDASKVLETLKARPACTKLVETAYAIRETQPAIAEQFMTTALKEMEDHPSKDLPKNGSQEVPTKELNPDPNSEGSAEGATSTEGTKKEGTSKKPSDLESEGGENQMKEGMGMPGMPAPQLAPQLQNQMMSGMQEPKPQMPPGMPTMPQMQQMQYMIKETLLPFLEQRKADVKEITKLKEALVALDGKVKETQSSGLASMKLDIPAKSSILQRPTRETIPESPNQWASVPANPMKKGRMHVQEIQSKISQEDAMITDGSIPKNPEFYQ